MSSLPSNPSRWILILTLLLVGNCPGQSAWTVLGHIGNFTNASSISVDPFGTFYVTDAGSHTIHASDLSGAKGLTSGGQGWNSSALDDPRGVDARLGIAIYVADHRNHRIIRMDKELNPSAFLSARDEVRNGVGFGYPLDVATDPLGGLYILDGENMRVVRGAGFDRVDFAFGGSEAGPGQLTNALALDTDASGNVYVLEPHRVVVFDAFGVYRYAFGFGIEESAVGLYCGRDHLIVVLPSRLVYFDFQGNPTGVLEARTIEGITEDSEFRDAAEYQEKLLLLTLRSVIVLASP